LSISPWSFSKIKAFEQCPKKFYHLKVAKDYAKGGLDALIAKRGDKLCEYKMGLTASLEPCDFFADDVWFRGIADLVILDEEAETAWVVDYKTGKNARYADKGQLELMALATFKHFPKVKKVRGGLMFVVSNDLITDSYDLVSQGELWRKWLTDIANMESAFENDTWNANPSGLCRAHCVVLECPHNGRS
jgi:CRISPR/Cas system-associated exonuclease Cas4 (RecB family)